MLKRFGNGSEGEIKYLVKSCFRFSPKYFGIAQIKIGYLQNMEFWSLGHKVQVEAKLKLIFYEKAKKPRK